MTAPFRVALTYDDGPSQWTKSILDTLAWHNAKATFFVVGQAIYQHPDLLVRMVDYGHEVGNHTRSHNRVSPMFTDELSEDLAFTSGLIEGTTGKPPTLWRAPHFDVTNLALNTASGLGLAHVSCTIDPSDWNNDDPDRIANHVIERLEPGSIVDLHDGIPPDGGTGTNTRQPTVEATKLILKAMPHVQFVTIPNL